MDLQVCGNVYIPMRSAPSHRSEMVSQLVFGEKFSIESVTGSWLKIRNIFDGYTGWVDAEHLQMTTCRSEEVSMVINRALRCYRSDGSKLVLEAGSEIYDPDFAAGTFRLGNEVFRASESFSEKDTRTSESLAETALRFINSPYIWGGRVPSGIDCSGFTQLVYKIHGIALPRDSSLQVQKGSDVGFIDDALPGDLVFFDSGSGSINHTGLIISRGLVIHASGRVRIDRIDHSGIYRDDLNRYTHRLRAIRRISI